MSLPALQEPLPLPETPPAPVKRTSVASRPPLSPVPPAQSTVLTRLTPTVAERQALDALTDAGLRHHVSRVLTWPTSDRSGCLTTCVLLRHGADPEAVHDTLLGLTGVEGSHRGRASVSVYRRVVS